MTITLICAVTRIRVIFLYSCFVLISFFCTAQDFVDKHYWAELMRYNYLPIDSLWLFHPGSDFSSLDSNDAGWEIANTELLQNKNGGPLSSQGIGWYQKRFDVPVTLRSKPVALRMGQFGASEIFLDGKLIQRYGAVGNSMENEKIYVPREPVIIYLDSNASHKLLVHYSNLHANRPGYGTDYIGFRLLITLPNVFPQTEIGNIPTVHISVGIMLAFSIFFLFVWFFYPKRLASLITVLWLLNFCVVLTSVLFTLKENEWDPLLRAYNITGITSVWINYFALLVLFALYYRGKMPRRTWLVIAGMILCAFAISNPRFIFLIGALSILVYFEICRMFILGIRNKRSGFWILLIGWLIQQAGFFFLVLDIFDWFPVSTPQLLILTMIFPQLGIPLAYALHLAWEFGSANRDLSLQLIHVNELSQKSLKQEQEKQQLLASQNVTLEKQVEERTAALSKTITELKSTQAQLIQSEKMASLGELTAGIAHEIQNPLNFVNNFSEVNNELIDEMMDEVSRGNYNEAKAIGDDLKQNLEKILQHGKRADGIVKGMLQHSRSSSGQKEPTDINALTDEYLRLAYHGLRAKDKTFNATLQSDYDDSIGNINIIPQDIGRVILNLITNAFYVVAEKKKLGIAGYEPTVSISTKKKGDVISIAVKDNGFGIPQRVFDKIFQPFFTTKPAGQGTGLGLSLAYDIVKAHGGELKAETKEGQGSTFFIQLPVN